MHNFIVLGCSCCESILLLPLHSWARAVLLAYQAFVEVVPSPAACSRPFRRAVFSCWRFTQIAWHLVKPAPCCIQLMAPTAPCEATMTAVPTPRAMAPSLPLASATVCATCLVCAQFLTALLLLQQ